MEMQYFKHYSYNLNRDMECKVYGHAGRPVLFIPCQDGRYFDFEGFKLTESFAHYIESGQVMVFAIDTIDLETWSNKEGNPNWRIRRHEEWIRYITDEFVPFMRNMVNERNGWTGYPGVMVFGCSLGASHALNLFYRRPDLFDRLLALSGIYTSEYGFGDYMDSVVYDNSPVHYLENMPADHPYINLYNQKKAVICVGLGPWEIPDSTRKLADIFYRKGINNRVEFWGEDVKHDWDWWYKQLDLYLPYLIND